MAEDAAADASQRPAAGAPDSPFWSLMLPVLGVIGTGIGVIGFVIFFGGFIVWTRFDAAGLPADEAVAQIPRNDLIVTGAGFLVPALLAALVAVAATVGMWDLLIGNQRRARVRERREELADRCDQLDRVTARVAAVKRETEHLGTTVETLAAAMERHDRAWREAAPRSLEREHARGRYDKAEEKLLELQGKREQLLEEQSRLEATDLPAAQRAVDDARHAIDEARELTLGEKYRRLAVCGVPMLAVELWLIFAGLDSLNVGLFLVLLLIAAATIGMSVVVVSNTDHLAWYALMVFAGVGIVIAASTYLRTHNSTKVSPVAAVSDREPVVGFFVAETSDAIYVARPALGVGSSSLDRTGMTLQRLPKARVTRLTVGPLASEMVAFRRSVALARALCRHRVVSVRAAAGGRATSRGSAEASASAVAQVTSASACTRAAIKALDALSTQIGA